MLQPSHDSSRSPPFIDEKELNLLAYPYFLLDGVSPEVARWYGAILGERQPDKETTST
jgi:hypothetical protein